MVRPIILKGNKISQTSGKITIISSANGQHMTRRIHHTKRTSNVRMNWFLSTRNKEMARIITCSFINPYLIIALISFSVLNTALFSSVHVWHTTIFLYF